MAKVDIYMPIFIGDYLKDTQDLDAEEHGAYFLLLMHYWLKKGQIGSDVHRLARVAKTTEEITKYILDSYFTLTEDGYKNKRAEEERAAAENRRVAASENGRKGGRPKKPNNNQPDTHRLTTGKPNDNPDETSSSSSSSSSSNSPPPLPHAAAADRLIKHWNSLSNLPPYTHSVSTLLDSSKVEERFTAFSEEIIFRAVSSLSEFWEDIKPDKRTSGLKNFLTYSIDSWVPSAHPEQRYKKRPEHRRYIPEIREDVVSQDIGEEQLGKVKSIIERKKGA